MDYSSIYDLMITVQCQAYAQMLQLIEQIFLHDKTLFAFSAVQKPDAEQIRSISSEKETLIQTLDILSQEIYIRQETLNQCISSCPELTSGSAYAAMQQLQKEASLQFQQLLSYEDSGSPAMVEQLTSYKESLELDLQIQAVPDEQRHFFYIKP